MDIGLILGGAVAFVVAIFGAWFGAKRVGRAEATADVATRDAARVAESASKAAAAQVNAANQSMEVRNEVSNLGDGSAADELLKHWSRDGANGR